MAITEPGIYQLSNKDYHADPALGSSGARELIKGCPASFRHKQDNPEQKEEFDIGSATHLLVLEPALFNDAICIVDAKDYKTNAAKATRDAARVDGKIPLLPHQFDMVLAMRDALDADPIARHAFRGGAIEESLFWRDPLYGFMCKARPDRRQGLDYILDLKSSTTAHPDMMANSIAEYGYHQQGAWYGWGIESLLGKFPDRVGIVAIAKTRPYLNTICWLDDEALGWGRELNRLARGIYAWCLERNEWPSYTPDITEPRRAFTVSLPYWELNKLRRMQEQGLLRTPQERSGQGPVENREAHEEADAREETEEWA